MIRESTLVQIDSQRVLRELDQNYEDHQKRKFISSRNSESIHVPKANTEASFADQPHFGALKQPKKRLKRSQEYGIEV